MLSALGDESDEFVELVLVGEFLFFEFLDAVVGGGELLFHWII